MDKYDSDLIKSLDSEDIKSFKITFSEYRKNADNEGANDHNEYLEGGTEVRENFNQFINQLMEIINSDKVQKAREEYDKRLEDE